MPAGVDPLDVSIEDDDVVSGVVAEDCLPLGLPAVVLAEQDAEPSELAALVPFAVRRHDGVRDLIALQGLLGGGDVVRDGFVLVPKLKPPSLFRSSPVIQPSHRPPMRYQSHLLFGL